MVKAAHSLQPFSPSPEVSGVVVKSAAAVAETLASVNAGYHDAAPPHQQYATSWWCGGTRLKYWASI